MQAHQQVALSARENQAFALMSRLHVILRRQTQRITDIEYMRISPAYCRHVLDLAAQSSLPDIQELGAKLEDLFFGKDGLFIATAGKPGTPAEEVDSPDSARNSANPPTLKKDEAPSESATTAPYVGRLR